MERKPGRSAASGSVAARPASGAGRPARKRKKFRFDKRMLQIVLAAIAGLALIGIIISSGSCISSGCSGSAKTDVKSETKRTKITSEKKFVDDCITDELKWFDSTAKAADGLKDFWKVTGVQPYVILKSYDSSLKGDEAKDKWAADYIAQNLSEKAAFVFVYFAEENSDVEVGHMSYAASDKAVSVMDAEAVGIFKDVLASYWYTNVTTDELFAKTFNKTAASIMQITKKQVKVGKYIVIDIVVIIVGAALAAGALFLYNKEKQRRRRARRRMQ